MSPLESHCSESSGGGSLRHSLVSRGSGSERGRRGSTMVDCAGSWCRSVDDCEGSMASVVEPGSQLDLLCLTELQPGDT